MPNPGFGNEPSSRAVRITVVGHASSRWHGARSQAEASRLNLALSNQRAHGVRMVVEQILKRQAPDIQISGGVSSLPSQGSSGGAQVGDYGVGSRDPLIRPASGRVNRNENSPLNRSVVVFLEMITTQYRQTGATRRPLRVDAHTRFWNLKVEALFGAAAGVAVYYLVFRLRNPLSGKTARYSGYILGGGVSTTAKNPINLSQSDIIKQVMKGGVGEEVELMTDEVMGFDDFDGTMVRVEKAKAALGIKASLQFLSFFGLGSGAEMLEFQHSIGLGLSKSVEAFVASGAMHMEGASPGDWWETDGGTDAIPYTTNTSAFDGIIVTYPTGKANFSNVSAEERNRLHDFVTRWAQRL